MTSRVLIKRCAIVALALLPQSCGANDAIRSDQGNNPEVTRPDQNARAPDLAPKPCPPQDIADCLIGAMFADCAGGHDPVAYCSSAESGGCLWVSNGCPLGPYQARFSPDCNCSGPNCPPLGAMEVFAYTYGFGAWDRSTAMALAARIDPAAGVGKATAVECSGADPGCLNNPNPCCDAIPGDPGAKITLTAWRSAPGTFIERLHVLEAMWGWDLLIEVDTAKKLARACRVGITDFLQCRTPPSLPECASSGTVTLNTSALQPSTAVGGTFVLEFKNGLRIAGVL